MRHSQVLMNLKPVIGSPSTSGSLPSEHERPTITKSDKEKE